ncbi:MAG TPA: hypothetical protein VGR16_14045 [Thermomicrobiales bacterium]|nr:hypothetical protein [Thermomicrobiales bacterium]
MALTHEALKQKLLTALDDLPAEALGEVIAFVDYQLYKLAGGNETEASGGNVRLGGLWDGVRAGEEDIADVRRESRKTFRESSG